MTLNNDKNTYVIFSLGEMLQMFEPDGKKDEKKYSNGNINDFQDKKGCNLHDLGFLFNIDN